MICILFSGLSHSQRSPSFLDLRRRVRHRLLQEARLQQGHQACEDRLSRLHQRLRGRDPDGLRAQLQDRLHRVQRGRQKTERNLEEVDRTKANANPESSPRSDLLPGRRPRNTSRKYSRNFRSRMGTSAGTSGQRWPVERSKLRRPRLFVQHVQDDFELDEESPVGLALPASGRPQGRGRLLRPHQVPDGPADDDGTSEVELLLQPPTVCR